MNETTALTAVTIPEARATPLEIDVVVTPPITRAIADNISTIHATILTVFLLKKFLRFIYHLIKQAEQS